MIRAPICAVVGHVDHGKTTLLDVVRGTAVAAGEAGAITQAIGASIIPIEHIKKHAASLQNQTLTVPGLLFIDTPGHAAFTGMRKRGGSLADIAVLIVDINEGFKPQTKEALEILKAYKTPFVVAANKIDLAPGYNKKSDNVIKDIEMQTPNTKQHIETKIYEILGTLSEMGFESERVDRLESFERQIAIVPISAKNKHGTDNLLAVLVGLAQRYLEKNLGATLEGPAKGTILEVKEEQGMGVTLDVILYDGTLDVGDTVVIGTMNEPIITKIRGLFQPAELADIRESKFKSIKQATAATGVKISAPGLEGATAGMPVIEVSGNEEEVKKQVSSEIEKATIGTDEKGIIIKADNIGSLEALTTLLGEKNIPIRVASIGAISKKDLMMVASHEKEQAIILAFSLPQNKEPVPEGVKIIQSDIIYKLIDDYELYQEELEKKQKTEEIDKLPRPARIQVLPNCIFRQNNPLVCGVEVKMGILQAGRSVVNEKNPTEQIAVIKEIQDKAKTLEQAETGAQVAISLPGATAGRHVNEGDVLWATITEEEIRELRKHTSKLGNEDINVLKEFSEVMREKNPMWGV